MGFRRILLTLVALAIAGPASALPVMFTGEQNSAGRPLGTSAAEALGGAAMAAGLMSTSILASELDLLGTHGLSVTNELTMNLPSPPIGALSATSNWTLSNDGVIGGQAFLVVASFSPTDIIINGNLEQIDYAFPTVGLDIDGSGDKPWGFFEVDRTELNAQADPIYLMMIDLGMVDVGETVAFDMPYYLEAPQSFLGANGVDVVLPKLELMTVFVPIPEPSTGLLMGLGLGGLVLAGKRRE